MQRAWCWAVMAALGFSSIPGEALARVPTRLVYARAPSAKECPDESALVAAVAARLGYDPFSPWGDQTILATISRVNGTLVGRAQLIDHDGIAEGNREVKQPERACDELILAMALAISITLDPLHGATPEAEPDPPVAAPAPEAVAAPPSAGEPPVTVERATVAAPVARRVLARPRKAEPSRSSWRAEAGALSALWLAPEVSFGGRLGVEGRRDRWSLALEGLAVLPTTSAVAGGGAMDTSLLAATLVPCFELLLHTRLCAIGSLGSLSAEGRDIEAPRSERVVHAAVGGRARLVWPVGRELDLLASADLLAVLHRPQFQLDGVEVWRPRPIMTVLGLGASVRFF